MFTEVQGVQELPATAEMLEVVAAFIPRARKWCPFYDFTVLGILAELGWDVRRLEEGVAERQRAGYHMEV